MTTIGKIASYPYVFPGKTMPIPLDWEILDWKTLDEIKIEPLLIYIAAPYTLGDVAENVRFACEIGDEILKKGHIPFVPHLTHFWHFLSPKPWEEWLRIDNAILDECDALLRVGGGESKGADLEVQRAKDLGIPVYYSLKDIPNVK